METNESTPSSSIPNKVVKLSLGLSLLYFIHNRDIVIDHQYHTFLTIIADFVLAILTLYMPATITSVYFKTIQDDNLSRFATGAVYAISFGTYLGVGAPLTLRQAPSEVILYVCTLVYILLGVATAFARRKRSKQQTTASQSETNAPTSEKK